MIKTLWTPGGPLLIDTVTAEASILPQVIDIAKYFTRGEVAAIELEIKSNGTAPGAAKVLNLNYAFSSDPLRTPVQLASAAAVQECAIPETANTIQCYTTPIVYQNAQYLFIWFDHDAIAAGATLELTLRVNGPIS